MRYISIILAVTFNLLSVAAQTNPFADDSWTNMIQSGHPRLFFNQKSFKTVKERALKEESELFGEMKNSVDALMRQESDNKAFSENRTRSNNEHEYGTRAAEVAFVYLVTEDKQYLELTKSILLKLIEHYKLRNEQRLEVNWYAYSRINALVAYDWIFNDLTKNERIEIGAPLLETIYFMIPSDRRQPYARENDGDFTTGFYGSPCLSWYAGIAFYNDGINDSIAKSLVLKGYNDYNSLLNYRNSIAGKDGGASTPSPNYFMAAYPWAEFSFFHTVLSATGIDISNEWLYVPNIINYLFWNWLPGNREFGSGDTYHLNNDLPMNSMHIHFSQLIHFYGKTQPELIAMAKWMQTKVVRQKREVFPFTRFLLTNTCDEIIPIDITAKDLPKARLFENMGQVFMRSGSGDDDTYALFTGGGVLKQHKHFDNNNFVIFKKGFLALDAGTRPEPGLHLSHYYSRTVAHNCILIRMPDEKMPYYWGGPAPNEERLPVPNDGGQNSQLGSKVIAFDENKEYVYVASDATKSYHNEKTNCVVRQFVFLLPDCFVVFDRVNASKAEYPKTWLLHTAEEPVINEKEFYVDQMEGRLFCRTLFPEEAQLTKIGGPGKQFWSDGRNWSLQPGNSRMQDSHDLYGQWRMEITPSKPAEDDCFLHVLQVGDQTLKSMVKTTPLKKDDKIGVKFTWQDKEYEVTFNTKGNVGGTISISQDNRKILEENFTEKVKSQHDFKIPAEYLVERSDIPAFWISTVEDVSEFLSHQVKKGQVEVIGASAGGRPMHAVVYGNARQGNGTSTFSGALGFRDVRAYRGRDHDKTVYWSMAAVHGFEMEGIVGMVNLISVLETGKDLRGKTWPEITELAAKIDRLILIPITNPDGRARLPLRMELQRGEDGTVHEFLNTGGNPDGTLIGWPQIKEFIPFDFSKPVFPGGYPNDAGYNFQHDNFMGKMQPETQALFDLATRERPDLIINMHTGADYMKLLRPLCEPVLTSVFDTLYRYVHERLTLENLQATKNVERETAARRAPVSDYNLDTALNLHCGALCVTVESPSHGFDRKTSGGVAAHTPDNLLDAQLLCHQEAMRFLIDTGGRSKWTPPSIN